MKSLVRVVSCLLALGIGSTAWAVLPIELEVATQPGISLTAPQHWSSLLGQMNLARVRLRGIQAGDTPRIEKVEFPGGDRYRILAILNSREQLVFPERRFSAGDRKSLQDYLRKLPTEAKSEPLGRFDLTEKQFTNVFAALSQPVDYSTEGESLLKLLARMESSLTIPVKWQPGTRTRSPVALTSELQSLSSGTALAISLRAGGMSFRPALSDGEQLHLVIEVYRRDREVWPVGWKSEASPRQIAPQLYKARTIEIGRNTLTQALDALHPRLKVPVILDQWILDQRRIDPDQITVVQRRRKTYLKGVVDRLLSQARLAGDLRVDEQGEPFLWVTQYGKDSPRTVN